MEENLYSINAMKNMEVIDINTGGKIGFIKDFRLDDNCRKIISIILPGESKIWFSKGTDIEIQWENIVKVGVDVLLVNYNKILEEA